MSALLASTQVKLFSAVYCRSVLPFSSVMATSSPALPDTSLETTLACVLWVPKLSAMPLLPRARMVPPVMREAVPKSSDPLPPLVVPLI